MDKTEIKNFCFVPKEGEMVKKIVWLGFVFVILLTFVSCASKPVFSGKFDLSGMVIDENDKPVSDFVIFCKGKGASWQSALTNENGLFVFYDQTCGTYSFKGEKEGFLKMEVKDVSVLSKTKLLCFQVSSLDRAFDNLEEMILCGDFEGALTLIKSMDLKTESPEKELSDFYMECINQKKQKKGEL